MVSSTDQAEKPMSLQIRIPVLNIDETMTFLLEPMVDWQCARKRIRTCMLDFGLGIKGECPHASIVSAAPLGHRGRSDDSAERARDLKDKLEQAEAMLSVAAMQLSVAARDKLEVCPSCCRMLQHSMAWDRPRENARAATRSGAAGGAGSDRHAPPDRRASSPRAGRPPLPMHLKHPASGRPGTHAAHKQQPPAEPEAEHKHASTATGTSTGAASRILSL
mmetsp:Transcript_98243/g.254064  ORF Transcript_98243/g.254064 Transcript_98243/m.254064 type:complete len:220 (-) Transcript_98243:286-945(-)|eukprot:CAMPEP_0195067402 /NCGR_PEP_ID=MMETSP0448-20130528/12479_1 /TAXON_ID=66468 /ORGANISM="Heterocapsa triquestra, Strain CCMP 448" /LENGTH=219 /DNA_ID=CAMNT_0040098815 /DNA_START=46 /DNA_END=705 /DNA_ORIENTATION=-